MSKKVEFCVKNLDSIMEIIIPSNTGRYGDTEKKFLIDVLKLIQETEGDVEKITTSIKKQFVELPRNLRASCDPRLIARSLYVWFLAYPGASVDIMRSMESWDIDSVGIGEGLIIGLLDAHSKLNFWESVELEGGFFILLNSRFFHGAMVSCMPTSAGSGHMTSGINKILQGIWLNKERYNMVGRFLSTLTVYLIDQHKLTNDFSMEEVSLIQKHLGLKFLDEFTKRLYISASLRNKAEMVAGGLQR